ncbi:MAG: hypothetical protein ACUVTH_00675 [Thermogutta sp.]
MTAATRGCCDDTPDGLATPAFASAGIPAVTCADPAGVKGCLTASVGSRAAEGRLREIAGVGTVVSALEAGVGSWTGGGAKRRSASCIEGF